MALPAEVTKATGLSAALDVLGIPSVETIGVGDAENDQAFLNQTSPRIKKELLPLFISGLKADRDSAL